MVGGNGDSGIASTAGTQVLLFSEPVLVPEVSFDFDSPDSRDVELVISVRHAPDSLVRAENVDLTDFLSGNATFVRRTELSSLTGHIIEVGETVEVRIPINLNPSTVNNFFVCATVNASYTSPDAGGGTRSYVTPSREGCFTPVDFAASRGIDTAPLYATLVGLALLALCKSHLLNHEVAHTFF